MSNPLHPEGGIVVSRAWLEEMIGKSRSELEKSTDVYERLAIRSEIITMKEVLENSQPLKPVLEVAYDIALGVTAALGMIPKSGRSDYVYQSKTEFINNPIGISDTH